MGDKQPISIGMVFPGGGARAAYQAGVMRYIAEQKPQLNIPIYTGVSAGSINAAHMASHQGNFFEAANDLWKHWEGLTIDQVVRANFGELTFTGFRWIASLLTGGASGGKRLRGLLNTSPLRKFLERSLKLDQIENNVQSGKLRAVAISATSMITGKTVSFVQGTQDIPYWERVRRIGIHDKITIDHIMASTALPIVFPAHPIRGEFFTDGSVRQTAPLAPAIHLGANRILAISGRFTKTIYPGPDESSYPPPAKVLGLLFHSIFLDSLDADAERMERINRILEDVGESKLPDNLKPVAFKMLRPSQDFGTLAGKYKKELPRSFKILLRGLGASRTKDADFLSYLMFTPGFMKELLALGYEDAQNQWGEIEEFLFRD